MDNATTQAGFTKFDPRARKRSNKGDLRTARSPTYSSNGSNRRHTRSIPTHPHKARTHADKIKKLTR